MRQLKRKVFKNLQESKGAEFAENFRRDTCIRQLLGNLCRLHALIIKNAQKTSDFLIRK